MVPVPMSGGVADELEHGTGAADRRDVGNGGAHGDGVVGEGEIIGGSADGGFILKDEIGGDATPLRVLA